MQSRRDRRFDAFIDLLLTRRGFLHLAAGGLAAAGLLACRNKSEDAPATGSEDPDDQLPENPPPVILEDTLLDENGTPLLAEDGSALLIG
jgi:hypothetical protein